MSDIGFMIEIGQLGLAEEGAFFAHVDGPAYIQTQHTVSFI